MMDSETSAGQIRRITVVGLIINIALAALKFSAGIAGHSQAAVADAVHSLSDLATDIAVLFGVGLWSAPADESHPYGHRRIETLVTLLIGAALAAVAAGFCLDAVEKLRHPPESAPALIALSGSLLTIFIKEWLFRATRTVGKRVNSPAVIANAWHHRSDAFSSIPVVIAVSAAAVNPEWHFLDQIGALIVAAMIFKVTWDIAKPALAQLSEHGANHEEVRQIAALAATVPGVLAVHKIRTRWLGAGIYVDLHAEVNGAVTVEKGHQIAHAVQRKLIEQGPAVADVVVHIEPYRE